MNSDRRKQPTDGFELFRADSNCMKDPQSTLLEALLEDNLTEFSDVLTDLGGDVNQCYPAPHNKTCLELACENGQTQFVKLLLQHGADVNQHNKIQRCKPIHFTVNQGHGDVLKLLMNYGADVNAQNHHGRTPLHLLAHRSSLTWLPKGEDKLYWSEKFRECFDILLQRDETQKEIKDNKGNTPLHLAVLGESREGVNMLLSYGADIHAFCGYKNEPTAKTALEMIRSKMSDIDLSKISVPNSDLNQNSQTETTQRSMNLFEAMKCADVVHFEKCLSTNPNLESFDGNKTPLQYACNKGLTKFVRLLVDAGADVDSKNDNSGMYPLHYAAEKGNAEILSHLLKRGAEPNVTDARGDTPLHTAVRMNSRYDASLEEYEKCIDVLLDCKATDVNVADMFGNTPLHLVVMNFPQSVVMKFLKRGANMGLKNQFDETPVSRILPETLERFLNECIEIVDKVEVTSDDFGIDFNYSFLSPPDHSTRGKEEDHFITGEETKRLPETISLWYISQLKSHSHLLKHPVISSFLHFKWEKMRVFYYASAFSYVVFLCLVTSCLLLETKNLTRNQTMTEEEGITSRESDESPVGTQIMWYFILIFNFLFTLCEIFQIIVSPCRYVWTFENWLQWAEIVTIFWIYTNPDSSHLRPLQAVVILLVWGEMIMIMGRHPSSSTYISMFLTVSLSFIKFIAWYSILISAFALSFYVIFTPNEGFGSIIDTFMKSFVMMTGEFDFGEIPLDAAVPYTNIIFLGFLFFITIVLMNLLTGLAVSDTQAIREKAEILSYINQVEHISYVESMLLGDPTKFLSNYPPFSWIPKCAPCNIMSKCGPIMKLLNVLGRSTLIVNGRASEKVTIYPNRKTSKRTSITDNIIKSAIKVAQKGKDSLGILEASDRVKAMELKVASLENVIHALSDNIETLLSTMSAKTN